MLKQNDFWNMFSLRNYFFFKETPKMILNELSHITAVPGNWRVPDLTLDNEYKSNLEWSNKGKLNMSCKTHDPCSHKQDFFGNNF